MKTYEELMQIVDDLEPQIRATALQAEADCNVPEETVAAIKKAGLFKIWMPASLGGWEIDPVTAYRIFERISGIYSAAGWLVQMSNAVASLARPFGDRAVEELFTDGETIFSNAFNPPGKAIPVEGGYRLTGQFPFGSNSKHAHWFMSLGLVMEGDNPKMVDGNPVVNVMIFPLADAEIVDHWDTLGMRGTGSHDVKTVDLFVPVHRTTPLVPVEKAGNSYWSDEVNNLSIWHTIASVGVPALGIAQTAMNEFVELTKSKVPSYKTEAVNTHALAHYRLGEARARLGAARAYMYETTARVWDSACKGNFISVEQKCDMQLAGAFAARAACDAIEQISASAGTSVVRQDTSLNRHLRDLRTLTQHAFISADRYEDVGALTVGQVQKWGFLNF